MPRGARLDTPGTLHHVIVRSIERCNIVDDDLNRENFLNRLAQAAEESRTAICGWALLDNHTHELLRSGEREKGDVRILGSSEFVMKVIDEAEKNVRSQLAGDDVP